MSYAVLIGSAWHYIHEQFDFDVHTLASTGCAAQVYEYSTRWKSWKEDTVDGWYIGTSHEDYCCHEVFIKATQAEQFSDNVFFKHRLIAQPVITPADAIIKALSDNKTTFTGKQSLLPQAAMDGF